MVTFDDLLAAQRARGAARADGQRVVVLDVRVVQRAAVRGDDALEGAVESTLLYVLSHTTVHTNLHINKSREA